MLQQNLVLNTQPTSAPGLQEGMSAMPADSTNQGEQAFSELMRQQTQSVQPSGSPSASNGSQSVPQQEGTAPLTQVQGIEAQTATLLTAADGTLPETRLLSNTENQGSDDTAEAQEPLPLDIQVQQIIDQPVQPPTQQQEQLVNGLPLPQEGKNLPPEPLAAEQEQPVGRIGSKGSTAEYAFGKQNRLNNKVDAKLSLSAEVAEKAPAELQKDISLNIADSKAAGQQPSVQQLIQGTASTLAALSTTDKLKKPLAAEDKALAAVSAAQGRGVAMDNVAELQADMEISSKVDSKNLDKAIGQRIQLMVQQGRQVAEIRIDPPQLGKIEVNIQSAHQQLTVHMVADNPQVRDLLNQSAERLQQQLAQQQGVQVQVNVASQGRQDAQAQQGDASSGSAFPTEQGGDEIIEEVHHTKLVVSDNLLDLYG